MKRTISILTVCLLAISLLAGCGSSTVVVQAPATEAPATEAPATEAPAETVDAAAEATGSAIKLGLAILPSISGSKDATAEENGKASYDVTVAAVVVNGDGVIKQCIIDCVGSSIGFDTKGQVVDFDPAKEILSKNELGENYGMKAYAGSAYEWNEQVAALAQFAVGKTAAELRAGAVDEAGKAKDADLATVATIHIGSYVEAVEKAVANAQEVEAGWEDVLKLAIISSAKADPVGEKDGLAQLDVDVAAITMNGDTITACAIDSVQAKVSFDANGAITTDLTAAPQTKNELGEGYGMKAYAGATYEWNEQAANFAAYVTGKTAAEVAGIAINDSTKPAEGTDLAATVTISIGGFQNLIAKAAK